MIKKIKHPIRITQSVITSAKYKNLLCSPYLKLDHFICVYVLEDGYSVPSDAMMHNTIKEAKKACDVHNTYLGFNRMQVNKMVEDSFRKSIKNN